MAMKLVRKTADYKIFLRGDNRYAIQDASGKPVNGEEKVNILIAEDLVKVAVRQEVGPEVVEEAASEEPAAEEAPAEEPAAEEAPAEEPAAEEAPADEPAKVEAFAEEPAAEEAPAKEPAVEQAPAEEAPAEEKKD